MENITELNKLIYAGAKLVWQGGKKKKKKKKSRFP